MSKRSGRGRSTGGTKARAQYAADARPSTSPPPVGASGPVGKAVQRVAPRTPQAIEASLSRAGMDSSAAMGPGRPLSPYQGYSQPPRAMDYPVSVNIATRTRASWGLPSYDTIRAIIKAYDVARMCVNHKIDELRSMELMFLPAEGERGDVADAIAAARAVLAFPDRELPFDVWLGRWLENAFKFDSAPLYKRRNRAGEVIGLESLDGTTIMPYIDERGRRPSAPDPAYYQIVHGQPWNWYTHQDITYCVFRPQEDSPFGTAPMESLLLTANTDIRFQWHFLQMFTEGSIPGGFVEIPPDISSPDQVAEWQDYWDTTVMGDQAKLHQLLAVPAGTKVLNTKPDAFDPTFPEYLMMRTCAAHGVMPQDLGLIKDVNRANGETQTDIQFRVNTLPWVNWVQGILTRYLQRDIGLPVQVKLNTGRDKEDRIQDAQSWKIYVECGAASPDEMRTELLGLPVDNERPTPRFFNNSRLGPIPLLAIEGVSGKTDPETHGPAADQPALDMPYVGPVGIIPQAGTTDAAQDLAATDDYQVHERDQMLAQQGVPPQTFPTASAASAVAKSVAAAELAAFRAYSKARARAGRWRDFEFRALADPVQAHRLNDAGRAAVLKGLGAIVAAGLAVRARDTGRVLMLQRALDPTVCPCGFPLAFGMDGGDWWSHADGSISHDDGTCVSDVITSGPPDPAAGTWEFPGGGLADHESPLAAAVREWSEEVGILLAVGDPAGQWTSANGVYRGFVVDVAREADVPMFDGRGSVTNPDDPDGDRIEALAWWDPSQLPDNPAVRPELAAAMPLVLAALDVVPDVAGDELVDDGIVKASDARPKEPTTAKQWPGWERDLETAAHYSDRIRTALTAAVDTGRLASQWTGQRTVAKASADTSDAAGWLNGQSVLATIVTVLTVVLDDAYTEGYLIGARSATALLTAGAGVGDWGGWTPGDVDAANRVLGDDGLGAGLLQLLDDAQVTITSIGQGRFDDLAQALALSLERGDSSDTLAKDLRDILDDARWADMVATTEIARAVAAASFDTYRANGIGWADWLDSNDNRVCVNCDDNASNGPYPLDEFPTMPDHPKCRCAPAPRVDLGTAPSDDAVSALDEGE